MRVMKKLGALVLGLSLVGGTVAYGDSWETYGDFYTEKAGAEDRVTVTCNEPTGIYAFLADTGPYLDNIFKVKIKCKKPKESGTQRDIADYWFYGALISENISVSNCSQAQVEFQCAGDSPYCDDDYFGEITCDGTGITVDQVQDR
jgi:hypothetical protein